MLLNLKPKHSCIKIQNIKIMPQRHKQKFRRNRKEESRPIPFTMKIRLLFFSTFGIIGSFFTAFSLLFAVIFISFTDFSFLSKANRIATAEGIIIDKSRTNSSINEQTVYAFDYEFTDKKSKTHRGIGYQHGTDAKPGDKINVNYDPTDPENSSAAGFRNASFSAWTLLFILPFMGVGVGLLTVSIVKGRKRIHLLKYGEPTQGILIKKYPTNTKINDQRVYELVFEFDVNGKIYHAKARSHKPYRLEDEIMEKILYDKTDPTIAVVIDEMPAVVKKSYKQIWKQ